MWTAVATTHRNALLAVVSVTAALAATATSANAAPPLIRTSASNQVPACVSPSRLMEFLKSQNPKVDPMYDNIARLYKEHGEKYGVRWDYAFFQMSIETGYLAFRRPGGKAGDVKVRQYNFAGIGTTGGGVPGDSYPDMSTGVLAQIQHLVAYSGEHVAAPIAPRTRLMQDNIIEVSQKLKRQVTFADLSGRWAADKRYGVTIEKIAERFREGHCQGPAPVDARTESAKAPTAVPAKPVILATAAQVVAPMPTMARKPEIQPPPRVTVAPPEPPRPVLVTGPALAQRPPAPATVASALQTNIADAALQTQNTQRIASFAPRQLPESFGSRASLGAKGVVPAAARNCTIATASYGGKKTLLLKSVSANATTFTLLQVVDGFETTMRDKFITTRAPGAEMLGEFASQDIAMVTAKALCSDQ
jgi:hypothetical protein